jgi:transcriptional regulator with XRE-family HTH domain
VSVIIEAPALTANQVVAWNLRRIRRLLDLTQREACERLVGAGLDWSPVVFSAAERSVDGRRIRHFDADEIDAFARAFGVPPGWFFLPPLPRAD